MIAISSVTKPDDSQELAAGSQVVPSLARSGDLGSEPDKQTKAERHLTVTGKSESRLVKRYQGAGNGLETVIGVDERQRILETKATPWRMVAALRMVGPSGAGAIGTGWLVGPRTMITAGHCVHHQGFFGGWASSIEISAGRNGSELPYGTITATKFSSINRWIDSADPDFDIGCIHLPEALGDRLGWFPIASMPPGELQNYMVNISGYPADRGGGEEQFFNVNRVLNVGERRIYYDVDTYGGQSGAPVWVHEADGAPPVVVAIHAYGTGGTPFSLGLTANSAPRIIPEVFQQIEAWIEADNGADS